MSCAKLVGMIGSVEELREVMEGTTLAGRDMADIVVPASRNDGAAAHDSEPATVLAVRIGSEEVLSAWSVARNMVELTGRWPVAVCSFDVGRCGSEA